MFRLLIVVLAVIGLVNLLGSAGGAVVGIGGLAVLAILLFKIAFVLMVFSFIGQRMSRFEHGPRPWRAPRRPGAGTPSPSAEDRFEDWHRMAHAREEVESWVEDLPE